MRLPCIKRQLNICQNKIKNLNFRQGNPEVFIFAGAEVRNGQ